MATRAKAKKDRGDTLFKQTYAKNIQRTLSPILYLHKLYAVVPFHLDTYRFQVIPFIVSTVLIYGMIYFYLIQMDVKKQVNSSKPYIFKLIPILLSHGQVIFSALLLGVCHFRSIRLNKKLRSIVLKLIKIDEIMSEQLNIHVNHTYMRIKSTAFVLLNCVLVHIVNLYFFHKLDDNIPFLFLLLFYMPNMYEKLYKMIFIVLTDMLRQRLRYLNAYLKHDLTDDNIIYVLEHDTVVNQEVDQYEGLHYLEKLNQIKLTSSQLRSILLTHSHICEVGKMINQSYGMQVLVGFIITFIVLVSMLFYLPVGILAHLSGKNNLFFSFAHLYWFILKMFLCIWFAKVITECQQEVLYTSKFGYELMIEDKVPSLTNQVS
ncbi:hypothetical protein M8J76_009797 [Diaphorina citri]|nr:hypothetical protein M8J76_009797 [Diaphorina citri]KAI5753150.1 hypothetical protein M8J77_024045 [Diaphorina citri]